MGEDFSQDLGGKAKRRKETYIDRWYEKDGVDKRSEFRLGLGHGTEKRELAFIAQNHFTARQTTARLSKYR